MRGTTRVAVPIGAPSPEIGNVVYSASDVDAEGYSVDPDLGPIHMVRRMTLAFLIAWVAFGTCWFGAMATLHDSRTGALLGVIAGAIAGWLAWCGMSTTKRAGSCIYVGTEGVTRIEVAGKRRTMTTAMFREDVLTTTDHERFYVNGRYAYTSETIAFYRPGGGLLVRIAGTYMQQPSAHAYAVRAAMYMSGIKRAHAAAWRLSRGERVVFPPVGRAGEAIVLDARTLAYYKSPTSAPLLVERSRASLALRAGYLDLTTRDSKVILGSFERSRVSNYDVLTKLVA
jgi:hypothetical protein